MTHNYVKYVENLHIITLPRKWLMESRNHQKEEVFIYVLQAHTSHMLIIVYVL